MSSYKCSKCGEKFDDKRHFEVHKTVHKHAKSKVSEYGGDMPWRPGL
jgi:transposase-like protein